MKALSDDSRLRIVSLLQRKSLCVCELEVLLSMSQSMASRHLLKLKQAGIVASRRDAQWIHYRLHEAFLSDNGTLAAFLESKADSEPQLLADRRQLDAYIQSGMNCEQLSAGALASSEPPHATQSPYPRR